MAAHDVHLAFLTWHDPKWDEWKSSPCFQEIVARCGLDNAGRVRDPAGYCPLTA
jgi:hypothetical protein